MQHCAGFISAESLYRNKTCTVLHQVGVFIWRIQKYLQWSSDSFCQLESSASLPRVIYFEAFYLHVVSSFSCIPVIRPELVLFLTPLQFVHLFCNVTKCEWKSQVFPPKPAEWGGKLHNVTKLEGCREGRNEVDTKTHACTVNPISDPNWFSCHTYCEN